MNLFRHGGDKCVDDKVIDCVLNGQVRVPIVVETHTKQCLPLGRSLRVKYSYILVLQS